MRPDERSYVLDSWRRSLDRRARRSRSTHAAADEDREALADTQRVVVADDGPAILGWCCFTSLPSGPIVHYVYTRAPHRRQGIARQLLEPAGAGRDRAIATATTTRAARGILDAIGVRAVAIDAAEILR